MIQNYTALNAIEPKWNLLDKHNGARAVGLQLGFKLMKRSRAICWEDLDLLSSISHCSVAEGVVCPVIVSVQISFDMYYILYVNRWESWFQLLWYHRNHGLMMRMQSCCTYSCNSNPKH